jgi:hypothetical protein
MPTEGDVIEEKAAEMDDGSYSMYTKHLRVDGRSLALKPLKIPISPVSRLGPGPLSNAQVGGQLGIP